MPAGQRNSCRGSTLELDQPGHLYVGYEHDTGVLVEIWRETFQQRVDQFLGDGGDDHDEYIILVEHQVPLVKAVTALAGKIVDDRVALHAGAVEQVGGELLPLALHDDLEFLERTEIKIFLDADFSSGLPD